MTPLQAALAYRARGFSPVPIKPREKRPLIAWKEFQQRRADVAEITEWYRSCPGAGVGIVTGEISGVLVFDVDRAPGALETARALTEGIVTVEVLTGSGGSHLWFRYAGEQLTTNAGQIAIGIDIRANGGLVVAPPTLHPCGERYRFVDGRALADVDLAPVPETIVKAMPRREAPAPGRGSRPIEVSDAYVRAALQAEMAEVAAAPAGTRNHTLNRSAFALARFDEQLLPDEEIFAQLTTAARSAGLTSSESARTIMSALRARRRSA